MRWEKFIKKAMIVFVLAYLTIPIVFAQPVYIGEQINDFLTGISNSLQGIANTIINTILIL